MDLRISLILPAYNEVHRLPIHMLALRRYLDGRLSSSYEVIVVDDGSDDGTALLVSQYARDWPQLILLRHGTNCGKGRALRTGAAAARGDYILITDADGATPIAEEEKLRSAILQGVDVAIGSRFLGTNGVQRSLVRNVIGGMFAWAVRHMLDLQVRDTQCGFKMFRREVGKQLFGMCRESGYLIDLELLMHARQMGLDVGEVPVAWRDVPGSKVHIVRDGWKMLRGLWRLRRTAFAEGSRYRGNSAESIFGAVGDPAVAGDVVGSADGAAGRIKGSCKVLR